MDLSGVFAGTFQAFKQRFALLILISLIPVVATAVFSAVIVAMALSMAFGVAANPRNAAPLIISLIIVGVAGGILMVLAFLKGQGMTTLAAYEIAQGQHPDLRGLWSRSKGFLPRMAPVIAIGFGAMVLVYGVILAFAFSSIGALDGRDGARSAGAAGLILLLVLAMLPVAFFLTVKLLYIVPAVAIEQLGGIDGMKRSWVVTRRAFWRTFGYYFVAALAVGVISYVVSMIAQLPLVGLRNPERFSDPRQFLASLSVALPLYLVAMGIQSLLQLVTQPFMYLYVAYMFIDQVRRSELPPASPYGYPAGPQGGYYAAPGQYYGQPGQAYPPQQYPGYGQPNPGYPPAQPGQGYPPPQPPQPGGWQPPAPPQPPQG
jgi:U5 snRNP spliceosome subunit